MAQRLYLLAFAVMAVPSSSQAGELFVGAYAHDINTPWTHSGPEEGLDNQIGWRGGRLGKTRLQPYGFLALNTAGGTNYGAVGISAKVGQKIFIRPGIGIAVHTGSTRNHFDPSNDEIEFGSRVLFEPELGLGSHLSDRLQLEASWMHMSHGQLFGRQNSGLHNFGMRLTWKFH